MGGIEDERLELRVSGVGVRDQANTLDDLSDDSGCFFFFQAEDGIRDYKVTGVQTCALPISFLATMSHEIRTPLYGALGTLELLGLTELTQLQRKYVDRIEASSSILLQIISDILDTSKIEADQLQLEKAPFNPRELVQNCTSSYAAKI